MKILDYQGIVSTIKVSEASLAFNVISEEKKFFWQFPSQHEIVIKAV